MSRGFELILPEEIYSMKMKISFAIALIGFCCLYSTGSLGLDGECVEGGCITTGTWVWPGGEKYEGAWKDGLPHGTGTWTQPDGLVYTGDFVDGSFDGYGAVRYPGGEEYVGEWKNSVSEGWGILSFPDGEVYKGGFAGSRYHGRGVLTWPDGIRYAGEFFNGEFSGQGVMELPNGSIYSGEWKNGLPCGKGTYTYHRGKTGSLNPYPSGFKAAGPPGRLAQTWQYRGEWLGGAPNGHGSLTLPDGERAVGLWRDGERYRKGVLIMYAATKVKKKVLAPRQTKRRLMQKGDPLTGSAEGEVLCRTYDVSGIQSVP